MQYAGSHSLDSYPWTAIREIPAGQTVVELSYRTVALGVTAAGESDERYSRQDPSGRASLGKEQDTGPAFEPASVVE